MKKIFTLLLMSLALLGLCFKGNIQAEASEEALNKTCVRLVEYIKTHLNEFKEEYNKLNEKPLRAVGIEGYSLVYIIDTKEYGIYLDFNDENGYLVSSFTLNLYDIQTTGDIEYLKDINFTYYSILDGFLYHNGTSYQKYILEENQCRMVYGYNGQSGTGEGGIYHLGDYIADRYPSYHEEEEQVKALREGGYIPTDMMRLSHYVKYTSDDGGNTYHYVQSEANCALTASFNVMTSWRQMGVHNKLPLKTVYKDMRQEITEDPNYAQYGTGVGGIGITSYWTTNDDDILRYMPELYYFENYFVTAEYHYTPESGLTTAQTKTTITFCTVQYGGGTIYPKSTTNFADIMGYLQNGRAVFMGVSNSQTFGGDHAVALLGYYRYSYKTGVWIFAQTKTAYFYVIDDGQLPGITYFDPNCNSNLSYEFIYAQ